MTATDSAVLHNDRMSVMPSRCFLASRRTTEPTRSRTIYNPTGFDPAEVFPPELHQYADHARYFLHVLYAQRVFKDLADEFVPLKAAYLRRFFPSNEVYKRVRDALLASGIVDCDGICRRADGPTWTNHDARYPGGKCLGYKLGPRWQGVRHERVTVTATPLLKSIVKVNRKRQAEIKLPTHRHVWDCLREITIDHGAAARDIDALMAQARPDQIDGYVWQRALCDGIRDKDWLWHVCPYGRVYNNLTGLKRSLRRHLRVGDHSLVGCDVANCQPLLVGLLCRHLGQGNQGINLCKFTQFTQTNQYLELDQEFLDRISLSFPQNQQEEGGGGEQTSLYDVVFTKSSQLVPDDLGQYISLCEEGKFYDELILLDDKPTDRETFKKQIFTHVFYGENFYRGRLTRLFAQQFPTVWETIQAIKKDDFKRLSHHMLRLEAEVVINRAVRRCALEGIWVVTIHDCLVTFPEYAQRVSRVMAEAFGTVGARPAIKVTAF